MDSELKSVTIMGKAMTGRDCPFDTDEVWGVNNVASQPEYCGALTSIKLVNAGMDYISPPKVSFEGDGEGIDAEAFIENGVVKSITVKELGHGFSKPPDVVITGGGGRGAQSEVTVASIRKFHKLFAFDLLPKEYTDGMKKFAPIMSWQDYADIPYPKDEIISEFNTRYFTNTISYMIAYVAHLRIPKVELYGIDVSFGAPYAQENRGVEYWIGRAEERGCKFFIPEQSHILRTVSGGLYGEKDHCNMLMFLNERINLINLLPREGNYSDSIKAQNAWWVLFPKEDEAKANGIQIQRGPNGELSFQCPRGEYVSDVHMPEETWEYLRSLLRDLEAKRKLPFAAITAYEKLILSKPFEGN